jgi:uncharacterized protein (DUF924 family)
MAVQPTEIVDFWVRAGAKAWFKKSEAFDAAIRGSYEAAHLEAARGGYEEWRSAPVGSLALLLLLDQFPRNLWRGSAHAYATDPLARTVARQALAMGHHTDRAPDLRFFFFLPFSHSEDIADQDLAVRLWTALEEESGESAKWAHVRRDIIARFGRFPHRNDCLGRSTTEAEQAFLDAGGFSG